MEIETPDDNSPELLTLDDKDEKQVAGNRLFKTFRAFGAGQIVYFVSQIAAIPLLITAWGKVEYGEWLLLASVPAYLTVADFGFGFAVANDVAMRDAQGDRPGAIASLHSAWAVVCLLCLLFAVGFLSFISLVPFWRIFHISHISARQCIEIALLLMIPVLLAQLQGVVRAPLRCEGNFVHGVKIKNLEAIGNLVATVVVATAKLSPLSLAAGLTIVSVFTNTLFVYEARRRVPWLTLGFKHAGAAEVKKIAWPAFTQNLIPLSTALSLQGSLSVIGIVSGAVPALAFSTARTMTRVISQLTITVEASFLPELSVAAAQENFPLARRLHHRASQLSFWISLCAALGLRVTGPFLYHLWTRGRLDLNIPVFNFLLLALVLNGMYFGSIAVPLAINMHSRLSIRMLILSFIALPGSYIACEFMGIEGVAAIVALVELAMLIYVVPFACKLVDDNLFDWIKSTLSPDFSWIVRRLKARVA